MPDLLLSHEPLVRFAVFAGILAAMMAWELLAPRREFHVGRTKRCPGNIALVVLDTLLVRLAFPVTAVGLALVAEQRGWGLFNTFPTSPWVAVDARATSSACWKPATRAETEKSILNHLDPKTFAYEIASQQIAA